MVEEINSVNDYNNVIKKNNKVVIFYGSKFCPHCVNITPYFKSLNKDYPKIKFAYIEMSNRDNPNIDKVEFVPTFVFYKDGDMLELTFSGGDKDKLNNNLKYLNK